MISFDRILIIRLTAVGDVIHVLPAFHALRKQFPNSRIAWAVEDKVASLLDNVPGLDEVIVFPRKKLKRALLRPWLWPSGAALALRHLRNLRAFLPTIAIDFQGNFKSGIHAWLSGAPDRAGFSRTKENARWFLNHAVDTPDVQHRVERPLHVLRALGVAPPRDLKFPFNIPAPDTAAVQAWLDSHRLTRFALCHIGASTFGAIKKWPLDNWSSLAPLLASQGLTPVFAWGPGERAAAEEAAGAVPGGRALVAPETPSLGRLAALIRAASLFVGVDSGPLHFAAALGTPVVALFGPKDPRVYGPYTPNHVVVWKGLGCSPCTRRHCPIPDCMNFITPEDVAGAAARLASSTATAAAPTIPS